QELHPPLQSRDPVALRRLVGVGVVVEPAPPVLHRVQVNRGVQLHIPGSGVVAKGTQANAALGTQDDAAIQPVEVHGPRFDDVERQAPLHADKPGPQLLDVVPAFRPAPLVDGRLLINFPRDALYFGRADQVEDLRDVINAHIKEGASPGHLFLYKRRSGVTIDVRTAATAKSLGPGMVDAAEATFFDDRLGSLHFLAVKVGNLNVKFFADTLGCLHHRPPVGVAARNRLFAVDVFARLQSGDRHRRVQVVVQADVDRVDVIPLQQLTKVGVDVGDSVVGGHTLGFSLVDVRHSDNLGSRDGGVLLDVTLTDDADADHSDADLVHFTLSPILSILTLFKKRVRREAP